MSINVSPGPVPATSTTLAGGRTRDDAVLGGATIATGLIAGLFYAYSCSVVPALQASSDQAMIEVMQEINRVIQNPVFFATFLGSPVLAGWATQVELRRGTPANAKWVAAGFGLSALCLLITFAFNIPLNDQLDAAGDPAKIANIGEVRDAFETPWAIWNIVRTVVITGAFVCLTRAFFGRGRRSS
jgi:uncharacterized membrane protein